MESRWGKGGNSDSFIFLGSKITVDGNCCHQPRDWTWVSYTAGRFFTICATRESHKPRQCIKKQRHHFADKGLYSQSYGFSSGHVWMWELDHKEGWVTKNWSFWIVILEKTLETLLDCKEIKSVLKGITWIFIGRTDAKTPILWPPDAKSQFTGKDPDDGKDWEQEKKWVTEDAVVGWHHPLNEHKFE